MRFPTLGCIPRHAFCSTTIDICVSGFHAPECHIYHAQGRTLRYDVCRVKAELEHIYVEHSGGREFSMQPAFEGGRGILSKY